MDWNEPFEAEYRFMRVSRATGLEIERLAAFEQSGAIERNSDTAVKESGSAVAVGKFDIGADFVRIYLDAKGLYTGEPESVPLGTFLVDASSRSVNMGGFGVSGVKLFGRLKDVQDDDFESPISVPAGSNPVQKAVEILESCGLEVIAEKSDYMLSTTWTFGLQNGEEGKLNAVNELLDIAGFASVSTDELGRAIVKRYVAPDRRPVAHKFIEGATARFIDQMTDELDLSNVANVVKVVCSTENATVIGIAIDDDPESQFSTVTLGRRIVKTYRVYDELTQAQADAKALNLLKGSQSVINRVTMRHVFVPNVRIMDAVSVAFPTGGVDGKYAIRTQRIELGAGCMVTAEVKRNI